MNEQERHMQLVADYLAGTLTEQEKEEILTYMRQGRISEEEIKGLDKTYTDLSGILMPEPTEKMRTAFYRSLEKQKEVQSNGNVFLRFIKSFTWNTSISVKQLAFGIAVLLTGIGLGYVLNPTQQYEDHLGRLTAEVKEMREMMMLTLLEQPSAIKRLKAVNISQEMDDATQQVADALLQTLNRDENVNVRLAALDALMRYSHQPYVREGLVEAIQYQESPLVQIALAEAMVNLQEKSSVHSLEELLKRDNLHQDVEKKVKESIQTLI